MKLEYESGKLTGKTWAANHASYQQISDIVEFRSLDGVYDFEDMSARMLAQLEVPIENLFDCEPSRDELLGLIDGAVEFWNEVEAEVMND